jgi:cation diffusion facilitator CzcD-associated flavoprotein CzcO
MKDIAVIGAGGVAGLACLHELLNTDKDGNCTIKEGKLPKECLFNVVGFEQKSEIGGTWFSNGFKRDPPMPSQEILDTECYDDVRTIRPTNRNCPAWNLESATFEKPIRTEIDPNYINWSNTALWPKLYTNSPESYMKYSTLAIDDQSPEGYNPFITHEQLRKRMLDFAQHENIQSKIRFNTEVYNVKKQDSKWILTLRVVGDNHDSWYQQAFDAIMLAQGSFGIPYIPYFKGLSQYVALHPGAVLHSKAYRDPQEFKDKRVVIIGGNISAIDLGQYLEPWCKEVIISRDLSREPYLPFMARCINAFKNVELLEEFIPETKELKLTNGQSLSDVDHVIIATGYHIELPFLEEGILQYSIPSNGRFPSSNSRIKGLYQHVFNIEDPSIVFVGKLVVQTCFRNMESQAAAVVGIWSGMKQLPSKQEQYKWEQERLSKVQEHLFHKYDIYTLRKDFFDPMSQFYLDERPDPLYDHLLESMDEYEFSLETFEKLFNEYRTGERDIRDD